MNTESEIIGEKEDDVSRIVRKFEQDLALIQEKISLLAIDNPEILRYIGEAKAYVEQMLDFSDTKTANFRTFERATQTRLKRVAKYLNENVSKDDNEVGTSVTPAEVNDKQMDNKSILQVPIAEVIDSIPEASVSNGIEKATETTTSDIELTNSLVLKDYIPDVEGLRLDFEDLKPILEELRNPQVEKTLDCLNSLLEKKGIDFTEADPKVFRIKLEKKISKIDRDLAKILTVNIPNGKEKTKARIVAMVGDKFRLEEKRLDGTRIHNVDIDVVNNFNWPVHTIDLQQERKKRKKSEPDAFEDDNSKLADDNVVDSSIASQSGENRSTEEVVADDSPKPEPDLVIGGGKNSAGEDDGIINNNIPMKESISNVSSQSSETLNEGNKPVLEEIKTIAGVDNKKPYYRGKVIDVAPDSIVLESNIGIENPSGTEQQVPEQVLAVENEPKIIIPSFVGGRGPKVTGGADLTDLRNKILQMSPKNQDHIESKEKIGSQITEIKKQLDNLNSAEQKTTYRSKDFGQKFTEPVSFETGEAKKWLDDKNEELLQKLHNLEAEVKSFEKNKRKNEIKALLYELNKAVSQTSYHSKEFSEMFGVELPYETGQAKAWIENKVAELEAELDKLENNPPKNPESPKGPLPDDPLPERSVALETPISPEQPDLVPEESGQINPNGPSPINPDLDNAMETINSDYSGTFGNEEESKTVDSALENQEEVEAKQKFSSASTSAQERRKMRDQAEIAHKKYLKEYQIYEEGMTNSSQLKRFGRGFKKFFGRETMPPELLKLREESDRLSALAAGASDEALAKRSAREAKRVFGRITDNVDGKEQLTEVQWQEKYAYNNKNQKTLESFRKKFFESRLKEELETRMRALPPEKQSAVANIMKQLGRHKWFMRALVVGGATLSGGALGAGAASIKMIASLGGAAAARGVGEFYSNRANKQLEEKRKDFKLGEDIRSSMSSLRSQLSLNERQQLRADAIKVAGTIGAGALAGSYADEIPDSVLDTARGYVPQPISDLFDQVENGSGNDLPPNDPGSSGSPSDPAGINNEDSTAVSATESVEASDTNEEADNQVEAEPVLHTVVSGDTLWEIMENKFAGKLSELSLEDQEKVLAKLVGDGGVVRDWDPESIKSYGFVSGDIDKIRIGQELDLTALGDRMQEIIDSKEYLESQPAEVLPETPEATVTEPTTVSEENVIQDEVQQMPSLERLVELGKVMEPELLADAMKDPYFESNVSNIGAENFVKQFNYFVENAGGEISGDTTLNHEASTLAFKELQNFTVADADYQLDRLQNEVVAEGGALTDYLSSEGVSVTSYLNLLEKVQYLLEEGGYLDENSKPFPASANQNVGELVLKEFASLVSHGSPFPSNLQVPPVREINV